MAVLTRKTQKVFAGDANGDMLAVMGTMKTGTPVYNSDVETLQSNIAYSKGWSAAILNDKAPYMEEMNGVQYAFSYQIAYLLQEGIPEYDVNTNYSKTSVVKIVQDNDLVLYHSLKDDNQGVVDITTSADWARLYIVDYGRIGQPQMTLSSTLPTNCIWLDGSAVSRTTYAALFAIYGTTYGSGNGSTTFNLPNFTNRAIWGASDFGYVSAGLPSLSGSTSSNGAHTHTRGTMDIVGSVSSPYGYASDTTGAFSSHDSGKDWDAENPTVKRDRIVTFRASRNWTGATSSNGAHTHTVTVSASTSGILGNSTTVQPPAIKVRVYTRWK